MRLGGPFFGELEGWNVAGLDVERSGWGRRKEEERREGEMNHYMTWAPLPNKHRREHCRHDYAFIPLYLKYSAPK